MSKQRMNEADGEKRVSKDKIFKIIAALIVVIVFIFFGYTIASQRSDIARLKNEKQEVSQQLDAQNKENEELQAILDSDDKEAYIEEKAREDYNYVKPNEQVFQDIGSGE